MSLIFRSVSLPVAYAAGWTLEQLYRLLRIKDEPRLTRFVVRELATSHWFDLTAARRDFGYAPQVSVAEGMARLRESLVRTV